MRKPTMMHLRPTDRRWAQIIRIAKKIGTESYQDVLDHVVGEYLATHQEATPMDITVDITVSEDSLFGGWEDMHLYDVDASLLEYTEQLCDRLMQEWTCTVSVTVGDMANVTLGDDNQGDRPEVDAIIGAVYESQAWVRYTRAGVEDAVSDGLWAEVGGIIISAIEIEVNIDADCEIVPASWVLAHHQGEMPAHDSEIFSSKDALLQEMEETGAAWRDWQTPTE